MQRLVLNGNMSGPRRLGAGRAWGTIMISMQPTMRGSEERLQIEAALISAVKPHLHEQQP